MSPCFSTARSEAISIAEDASQICEATAAVIRPPSGSGVSPAIFSSEVSRGHSSTAKSPTGAISFSNRPSSMAVRARLCEASANSSISSRLMSHFSAIISAQRNWETSWSPYRSSQPGDSAKGVLKPYCWADQHRRGDRDRRHVLQPAGDDEVLGAGHDALRGEVHGLLRGAALPVDGHAGHVVGQPGHQPGGAGDVAGLRADGVAAAHHHVVDGAGSMPVRSTSACSTWAPRSAECTAASEPPRLPTGVRTASTM